MSNVDLIIHNMFCNVVSLYLHPNLSNAPFHRYSDNLEFSVDNKIEDNILVAIVTFCYVNLTKVLSERNTTGNSLS